jgi:hypothetical protein
MFWLICGISSFVIFALFALVGMIKNYRGKRTPVISEAMIVAGVLLTICNIGMAVTTKPSQPPDTIHPLSEDSTVDKIFLLAQGREATFAPGEIAQWVSDSSYSIQIQIRGAELKMSEEEIVEAMQMRSRFLSVRLAPQPAEEDK